MLIDFQGMDGRHMALDFWYFLYTSTDSQWRKANLAKCYDAYFSILKGYLAPHWPDFTLEKLKTEFEGCRIIAGTLNLQLHLKSFQRQNRPQNLHNF